MSGHRAFSLRDRWFAGAAGLVLFVVVASAAAGFLWLPSLQTAAGSGGIWYAICSAAGLVRAPAASEAPVQATYKTTEVVLTPSMLDGATALSIGRGATLAMQCTMCHGVRGISEADSPNLAGQYAAAIFKQLRDYRSGARTSAIMSPRAKDLTDQDIDDIAAYYAYLPRLSGGPAGGSHLVPVIVANGAPMRNIAPCGACHGGVAYKDGAPWLTGESAVYLKAQLTAFASGARHNDISEQMRNVARGMTQAEIEAAAGFYAGRPGDGSP
jgi:cytochrome c553